MRLQELTVNEINVLGLLTDSKEKISMSDMAEMLNISKREVRECIEQLTLMGRAISNINGYSLIKNQEELKKVVEHQRKRLVSVSRRYSAIRKMANFNQIEIEL